MDCALAGAERQGGRRLNSVVRGHQMRIRDAITAVAAVSLANADAFGATPIGTWQYKDARVSMSIELSPGGNCRVTARMSGGMEMDAPCEYVTHSDMVIIDWKSLLPVKPYRVPPTTRLFFHPAADVLEMEGEPQVLTRWGAKAKRDDL